MSDLNKLQPKQPVCTFVFTICLVCRTLLVQSGSLIFVQQIQPSLMLFKLAVARLPAAVREMSPGREDQTRESGENRAYVNNRRTISKARHCKGDLSTNSSQQNSMHYFRKFCYSGLAVLLKYQPCKTRAERA